MNDPIKVKKDGPILEVTIDRPKANAIDSKTSIILGDIFLNFRDDPDLRVAIITGAGEKFFSANLLSFKIVSTRDLISPLAMPL